MKILEVKSLSIPEVKVIRFARFCDSRGYFSEHFRKSDLKNHPDTKDVFQRIEFLQMNESFSVPGVIRGLHFQWNPFMGKLVRTLSGHMIDIFLDIRKGSPNFGRAAMYDMPSERTKDYCEWIWVPPGFAHGNFFEAESAIEYLCSGEYSQGCEAGISPLAGDIDWALCDKDLKARFDKIASGGMIITDKDRNGFTLENWIKDGRSDNFTKEM
ncbi:MAG: dTDP-4-dehydrorhamnose 3,5-epimerase family protein [Brevinematales bacterium]|jgi:dTDP-4-dehydrorhamnose 3,5-epimerase